MRYLYRHRNDILILSRVASHCSLSIFELMEKLPMTSRNYNRTSNFAIISLEGKLGRQLNCHSTIVKGEESKFWGIKLYLKFAVYSYFRSLRFCTMDAAYPAHQSSVARRWPYCTAIRRTLCISYVKVVCTAQRLISWAAAVSVISEKRLVSAEGYLGRCIDWLQAEWPRN
jgi:hypothetical protein